MTPTPEDLAQPHAFFATRKGVPKGETLLPDGRKWSSVCDVCGEGMNTVAHHAASDTDHAYALLKAIEAQEDE